MKIYNEKVFWDMYYYFNLKNIMMVPKINKIVINSCFGKIFSDKKKVSFYYKNLNYLFSQKPKFIKSKRAISEFKLKRNENISFKITLRKKNMYDFFYKILNFYIYFIKNFQGFSILSFDDFGNYNIGIKDYSLFPEIIQNYEGTYGFDISINFKNSNFYKSLKFLKFLNFPFKCLN
ncbi:50S ribosomal subunit protein L5 [Candidatus Nasuia deltocephalinicola str. NAS-ALF]|uniref:50S ribosomal protein L5 n=1 Tax=Candidatus Nasuia deltocephalinicola str. NAS-ALF TaxID=1343077 RepID=S5TE50_9PROT|nr:50S ribosomal subunit protein L5 [Candidatus Nasuia deltocephalinicola str. NAS-ALF]